MWPSPTNPGISVQFVQGVVETVAEFLVINQDPRNSCLVVILDKSECLNVDFWCQAIHKKNLRDLTPVLRKNWWWKFMPLKLWIIIFSPSFLSQNWCQILVRIWKYSYMRKKIGEIYGRRLSFEPEGQNNDNLIQIRRNFLSKSRS